MTSILFLRQLYKGSKIYGLWTYTLETFEVQAAAARSHAAATSAKRWDITADLLDQEDS
jgi:hypothetical protein